MNVSQMARRCPTANVVGVGHIVGYQLRFNGVATIIRKRNSKVPVVLWELEVEDEHALDRYEGWPSFYRKEQIKVRQGMKWVTAMAYVMNGNRAEEPPDRSYYRTIEEGYKAFSIDDAVLAHTLMRSLRNSRRGIII